MIEPIEILKVGKFASSGGENVKFTEKELKEIADNYDAVNYPAPVVLGHPKDDAPAYGWLDRVFYEDGKLKATIKNMSHELIQLIKEGKYKKVSASLFKKSSPANPKQGTMMLKHLGFLGAATPAVSGLKPIEFSINEEQETYEFQTHIDERLQLAAMQKALLRQEHDMFLEKLADQGKFLPCYKDDMLCFMDEISHNQEISFSDGKENKPIDFFKDYLSNVPTLIDLGGVIDDDDAFSSGSIIHRNSTLKNMPKGYQIDDSQEELYSEILKNAHENNISFHDALENTCKGR